MSDTDGSRCNCLVGISLRPCPWLCARFAPTESTAGAEWKVRIEFDGRTSAWTIRCAIVIAPFLAEATNPANDIAEYAPHTDHRADDDRNDLEY